MPAAHLRRVPPRHRRRPRARARAARLHTRGGPRQDLPADGGVAAQQLRRPLPRAAARQLVTSARDVSAAVSRLVSPVAAARRRSVR